MSDWTLGALRKKSLAELSEMVETTNSGKPIADFYTAELARRASLATIDAAAATKDTAKWTKASAIAIALTFVVTAAGIGLSFYR